MNLCRLESGFKELSATNKTGVVLLRVYADTSNIGYYSVLHEDGCATLLPIDENYGIREIPAFLDPRKIVDSCKNTPLKTYYKFARVEVNAVHNDPRLDLGFYTEGLHGARLPRKKLKLGDIVLFMAVLAQYPDEIWYSSRVSMRKVLSTLRREDKIGVYLVGGIVVEKKVTILSDMWSEAVKAYPILAYSPHYYRVEDRDTFAILGRGFKIEPPLKIAAYTQTGFRITDTLKRLVGSSTSLALAKQRFRRSRYLLVDNSVLDNWILPYATFY